MTDEEHGAAALRHLGHLPQALLLEFRVADRQHFVDDQDLGLQMRRDRESEPDIHAGGKSLDRRVKKLFDFGKSDDLVETALDLGAAHAEDRAVEKNVLASGQLGMEAGADLKHAGDTADKLNATLVRLGNPADHLQ